MIRSGLKWSCYGSQVDLVDGDLYLSKLADPHELMPAKDVPNFLVVLGVHIFGTVSAVVAFSYASPKTCSRFFAKAWL